MLGIRLREGRLLPNRRECGQAEVHIVVLIQLLESGGGFVDHVPPILHVRW